MGGIYAPIDLPEKLSLMRYSKGNFCRQHSAFRPNMPENDCIWPMNFFYKLLYAESLLSKTDPTRNGSEISSSKIFSRRNAWPQSSQQVF
jgi:hypothetical protein